MRVLHVTPSFYPALAYGGPTVSLYNLCQGLTRVGCDVRVLTTNANGRDSVLPVETRTEVTNEGKLPVRYCRRLWSDSISPEFLSLLPSYVRWADVVHLTAVYSFPTIPTLLACQTLSKPVVWSPRGSLQRWDGSTRLWLKATWERACRVIAPSGLVLHVTSEQEALESGDKFPAAKLAIVSNGVEVPDTVTHIEQYGMLRLLYLGRIDRKKGIENLLNACRMFDQAESQAEWSLTIAGSGDAEYQAKLMRQIEELRLQPRVRMVGEVQGDAKRELFERASVLILPSYTENFGMVVAEALAYGVPVIASRATPWRRIEEMECGLWVDNDCDSLFEAIRRIRTMPISYMGQKGRLWMQAEFRWDSIAQQMRELYGETMERNVKRVSADRLNTRAST